jgi:lipid-binding SYLF domain-containing protein
MKKGFVSLLFIIVLIIFASTPAESGSKEVQKVEASVLVISEIMQIPEKSIPDSLLRKAYGIAIIPEVIKVGFVLGGRHGKGVILTRSSDGRWSNPSFVTLTGGSIGWQIGAQSSDVILIFRSKRSIDGIIKGKFTLGADASIAAGPVGRHAEAGTDVELKAEIYSYSRSRGLFAGIALEGAALQIDHDANEAFYGVKDIGPSDIFNSKVKAPASAGRLRRVIEKYSK